MNAALDTTLPILPEGPVEELQPGTTLLRGQYRIERFLNSGGFGLTYLARDSLDRIVVIKECFPETLCVRAGQDVRARSRGHNQEFHAIVELFIEEAHRIARLDHPGIVGVHQVFTDNTTAYMALDYIQGKNLLELIEDRREAPSPEDVREILVKLLDAVDYMHERSLLHRDISPDNILINRTGTPVLIDFGAARERATRSSRVLSRLQVVKDGYSPQEFYVAGIKQGPPSDLYALGATFHHLLAGTAPPDSQLRMAALASGEPDPYVPLLGRIPDYAPEFLAAIDQALRVIPKERPQSAREWLEMIRPGAARSAPPAGAVDGIMRDAIAQLVEETNRAVMAARERTDDTAQIGGETPPTRNERKPFFSWRSLDDDEDMADEATQTAEPVADVAVGTATDISAGSPPGAVGEPACDEPPASELEGPVGGRLNGGLLGGLARRLLARSRDSRNGVQQ